MPIGREKFQASELSNPMNLILDFLRSNSRYAYSQSEIKGELASKGIDLSAEEMQEVLSLLGAFGRVDSKIVEGETYYAYCKVTALKPIQGT